MKVNPEDSKFIEALKEALPSGKFENEDGVFTLTEIKESQQFPWHQRIFPAGIMMERENSTLHIFISKEELEGEQYNANLSDNIQE